jgi:putative Mn2+ efflux pump MntP
MSNGLKESKMRFSKVLLIAFMFGLFQGVMPLIGYLVGNSFVKYIEKFIPFIALALLSFLGIKMIIDFVKERKENNEQCNIVEQKLTFKVLIVQAIATSIDALSTGLAFSDYNIYDALIVVGLIAIITFVLCVIGVFIGKKFGTLIRCYATLIGGIILILIGLEIFITGIWF